LVSVMYANNEIGTIEPIRDIASMIREVRDERKQRQVDTPIFFFTDACQASGALELNVEKLGVDLLVINGSKMYGPKGVGCLYIKKGVAIKPIIYGGGQERGLRSGTENVPAIVGFGKAAELAYKNLQEKKEHLKKLSQRLRRGIETIADTHINSPLDGIETTISAAFLAIPAEVLLHQLEEENIFVSTGASCKSHKKNISHVFEALPVSDAIKKSSIRFGLSHLTTEEEMEKTIAVLQRIVPELRAIIPRDSRT